MNDPGARLRRFHLSVGSAFAGFLFFGGFESVIRLCRDPIAGAVIHMLNRFGHATLREEPATQWPLFWADLAVGLIFLTCAVAVVARKAHSEPPPAANSQ